MGKIKITITGKVEGDTLTGEAVTPFGTSPIKGSRVTVEDEEPQGRPLDGGRSGIEAPPARTVRGKKPSTASSSRPSTGRQNGRQPTRITCSASAPPFSRAPTSPSRASCASRTWPSSCGTASRSIRISTGPKGQTNIPVIICWSYFGKRPGDRRPSGSSWASRRERSRAWPSSRRPIPAYWCRHGYAIANADPRGVGHSEGDINMFGTQDGRDGYDFIEWLATQHWCNGKVGMFGNSGVAMVQWRIAAEQPPHLTCIAPWEGTGDLYRESLYEGGILRWASAKFFSGSLVGNGLHRRQHRYGHEVSLPERVLGRQDPEMGQDQDPGLHHRMLVPHGHLRASMEGFGKIRSTKKWLRATGSSSGPILIRLRPRGSQAVLRPLLQGHPERLGADAQGPPRSDGRVRVRLPDEPSGKGVPPCPDAVHEALRRCSQRANSPSSPSPPNRRSATRGRRGDVLRYHLR